MRRQATLTEEEATECLGGFSGVDDPAEEEPPSIRLFKPHQPSFRVVTRKSRSLQPRFPINDRTRRFRDRFFPEADDVRWNDWRWQLANRVQTPERLAEILDLSEAERAALTYCGGLPLGITPYYASLLDRDDPAQPLRRSVVPVSDEYRMGQGEAVDPLGEDHDSPLPGLVHRYPDRVLFLVTGFCSTYCRYCTRSRMVGHESACQAGRGNWERALEYIESTPSIRDVLLSGGDPLTMSDGDIDYLLSRLRRIPHVEIIRVGTKVPAVLPQRVTPSLVRVLRKYHPLLLSVHFTHPAELTVESVSACERLADAGIPLGSQTVLLKGINDDTAVMTRLMHGLLKARVRPYYLYQCDPIPGSAHFRTPVQKGLDIIRGMRGHTTGYAVPTFVIDAPGGGGKIPLLPDYLQGWDGGELVLKNYQGHLFRYPDHECGRTCLTERNQ